MEPLIAIVGATGTGKSKLAVDLATRFNGEIINGDAMQMYHGFPVITNKIPVEERNGIPHHLIDFIGLEEAPWTVATFKRECIRLIKEIHSRRKLPILVGGTHYYTQSVLFNDVLVSDGSEKYCPQSINYLRSTSERWPILDAPVETMLEKLREVDPVMAERWHPNETRKIRRSLEIYFQTGKPASTIYTQQRLEKQSMVTAADGGDVENSTSHANRMRYRTLLFWVHGDREMLHSRLDSRVDSMIDRGLISEARVMSDNLAEKISQGIAIEPTRGVWISIGFKELQPYFSALRSGNLSEEELESLKQSCIKTIKTSTRQYSVQQIKWIRSKLWNALASADMIHHLYILDNSDIDMWMKRITEPSERIIQAFLSNEPCPDPRTLSELAKQTFSVKEDQYQKTTSVVDDPTSTMKCITCETCHKTMMGAEQWDIHIRGYSHKRAIKASERRARNQEYLRRKDAEKDSLEVSMRVEMTPS